MTKFINEKISKVKLVFIKSFSYENRKNELSLPFFSSRVICAIQIGYPYFAPLSGGYAKSIVGYPDTNLQLDHYFDYLISIHRPSHPAHHSKTRPGLHLFQYIRINLLKADWGKSRSNCDKVERNIGTSANMLTLKATQ